MIRDVHVPEGHAGTPALAACTEGCSGPLDDEDGCAALPWYHTRLCLSVLLSETKGRGWSGTGGSGLYPPVAAAAEQ